MSANDAESHTFYSLFFRFRLNGVGERNKLYFVKLRSNIRDIMVQPLQHPYHIHSWNVSYLCFKQEYVIYKPGFDWPWEKSADKRDGQSGYHLFTCYATENPALWLVERNTIGSMKIQHIDVATDRPEVDSPIWLYAPYRVKWLHEVPYLLALGLE